MTFGSGSNGCLGHGNFNDVTQVSNGQKKKKKRFKLMNSALNKEREGELHCNCLLLFLYSTLVCRFDLFVFLLN